MNNEYQNQPFNLQLMDYEYQDQGQPSSDQLMDYEYQNQDQLSSYLQLMDYEYQTQGQPSSDHQVMDYECQNQGQLSSDFQLMDYEYQNQGQLLQLMDYEYQYQGQPSDQFHLTNKGKQVAVSLDIITEPDCEQNNMNGNNIADINDTTITTEILNVNDTFKDWNAVETAVNTFAKNNGFVAIKFRKDLVIIDKTITRRHIYQCWKAGINNPKNHNHQCDPISIELAPKNLRFPQSILDKIEHYTTKGNLSAGQQYDLLFRGVRVHDESDAATMFLYLLKQHEEDSNYVVIPHLEGPSNELTSLFWVTSKQRNELWPKFHDVVIHDNTAKMNKYEMALSLFVGIDNNFKTRVLAQALTKYETQADYIWILQCTLKVTNNLSPRVLYTDGNSVMLAAVQVVYPQTRHLLYIYHIAENIKKKAKALLRNDMVQNFIEDFYHMRNSYTEYQDTPKCSQIFTAGVESTQRVESINSVLKKHLDRGTLLKELVKVIENELDKEAQYSRIKEYYGSNPSTGLPIMYNTIFKNIDSILKDHLAPIPLSLQQAQMKQSLLYQGILISIDQVKESDNEQSNDIIERIYDKPQIRLQDLLSDINSDKIQEIWEIYYITVTSSTSTPNYVVILKDSTLFCTCMYIINQGMPCRHQYRVLLQFIAQGNKDYTTKALYYIDQIRSANVYTSNIKEKVSKKIEFGSTMLVAKTSVQVAVAEGVTSELIGLLTQFITKYHHNTGLNIEEVHSISHFNDEIQESSYNYQRQPLVVVEECNIPKISNSEYHKPKGHPLKRYKSSTEENNNQHISSSSKTCSYCLEKRHNIRGCRQHKADLVDKENNN
ncbi:protein FAR1-RELATED SEQUENCE 5-like [Rhizophagus irregularis DAOM 181602=DAOM 197198]|nr:protein FAR1-RELATED SEQUENCE 5-like [Rhizophagus irregularis DAOM 181602=DAOM 197198]